MCPPVFATHRNIKPLCVYMFLQQLCGQAIIILQQDTWNLESRTPNPDCHVQAIGFSPPIVQSHLWRAGFVSYEGNREQACIIHQPKTHPSSNHCRRKNYIIIYINVYKSIRCLLSMAHALARVRPILNQCRRASVCLCSQWKDVWRSIPKALVVEGWPHRLKRCTFSFVLQLQRTIFFPGSEHWSDNSCKEVIYGELVSEYK